MTRDNQLCPTCGGGVWPGKETARCSDAFHRAPLFGSGTEPTVEGPLCVSKYVGRGTPVEVTSWQVWRDGKCLGEVKTYEFALKVYAVPDLMQALSDAAKALYRLGVRETTPSEVQDDNTKAFNAVIDALTKADPGWAP